MHDTQDTIVRVFSRLTLHQQQRNQNIPTFSVLGGERYTTRKIWQQWITNQSKTTVIWSINDSTSLLIGWLGKLFTLRTVRSDLLHYLADATGYPTAQIEPYLLYKTEYELNIFQQRLSVKLSDTAESILRWLIGWVASNEAITTDLMQTLVQLLYNQGTPKLSGVISACAEILPTDTLPGLLVELQDGDISSVWSLMQSLADIVELQPNLPIAISASPQTLAYFFSSTTADRIHTMLRAGAIDISSFPVQRTILPSAIKQFLNQHNAPARLIDEAELLVRRLAEEKTGTPATRSQAEQFLFHILELIPDTRHQFKPNYKMPFNFGNQAMEIDLYAPTARLAIEIDGYYHFQEPDAWRRDRRKDFELQTKGILILRFLANDVVNRLEEIISTICQALQHNHRAVDK
jgi:hypothetical protein